MEMNSMAPPCRRSGAEEREYLYFILLSFQYCEVIPRPFSFMDQRLDTSPPESYISPAPGFTLWPIDSRCGVKGPQSECHVIISH